MREAFICTSRLKIRVCCRGIFHDAYIHRTYNDRHLEHKSLSESVRFLSQSTIHTMSMVFYTFHIEQFHRNSDREFDVTFSGPIQSAVKADVASKRVIFLVLPYVNLLDLAGPAQVFHAANELGKPHTLLFCASQSEMISAQGLALAHLESPVSLSLSSNDLVIVPGIDIRKEHDNVVRLEPSISEWLRQAHKMGAHVASVCTGAFALGEAGLLNGRRCTTHWMSVADLQARYPRARVQDDALFVHDDGITTSAGIASGIDMSLSLIEQLYGPLFTAQVARYLVVYLRRNGTQSQDSVYLQYRTHLNPAVHQVQDYIIHHLSEPISLSTLSEIANMSIRNLARSFKEATSITPVQYHQRLQIELATTLISDPTLSIEEVAHKCGFEDARHFRRLWHRHFGTSPSESRQHGLFSPSYSSQIVKSKRNA